MIFNGCIPFPSRYKLWETYLRSSPNYEPRSFPKREKEIKSVYFPDGFCVEKYILEKNGFIFSSKEEANLVITFKDITKDKEPLDLPGINNNIYSCSSYLVTFYDRLNNIHFTKKYDVICRDTLLNQLDNAKEGRCESYRVYDVCDTIAIDIKKFAENQRF